MKLLDKICRTLLQLRLRPIRVFCFHHVSYSFDESTMKCGDWLPTDVFKQKVNNLRKERYKFISLPEACEKLKHDAFRFRKYAVLTADDGWASVRNILPWLNEQQIPVTLFLNPAYLDGKHYREKKTEQYLTWDEVEKLASKYPLVTIGSHGWEHIEAKEQTTDEFANNVDLSVQKLCALSSYIPFFAYPYGRNQKWADKVLEEKGLIPVYVNGLKNYIDNLSINRELLK